jgi:hypothetical protein
MNQTYKTSDGETVLTYEQWRENYVKRDTLHWKPGRSSESLARYWTLTSKEDFIKMFTLAHMRIYDLGIGYIEKEEVFDNAKGRHSMCDLCFPNVKTDSGIYTISIEGKVDERFGGKSNLKYFEDAQKEIIEKNSNTEQVKRIESIFKLITGESYNVNSERKLEFNQLRFQLFSGLLGCIAEATRSQNSTHAIFVVHNFKTALFNSKRNLKNKEDLERFLRFFGNNKPLKSGNLYKVDIQFHQSDSFAYLKSPLEKKVYVGYLESTL